MPSLMRWSVFAKQIVFGDALALCAAPAEGTLSARSFTHLLFALLPEYDEPTPPGKRTGACSQPFLDAPGPGWRLSQGQRDRSRGGKPGPALVCRCDRGSRA